MYFILKFHVISQKRMVSRHRMTPRYGRMFRSRKVKRLVFGTIFGLLLNTSLSTSVKEEEEVDELKSTEQSRKHT